MESIKSSSLASAAAALQLQSRCLTPPAISMFKSYWYFCVFVAPENFNPTPSASGTEFKHRHRLKKKKPLRSDSSMNFKSYSHQMILSKIKHLFFIGLVEFLIRGPQRNFYFCLTLLFSQEVISAALLIM